MSLTGFDIASYQTGMDVDGTSGDFVLVKVTEGTGYTNPSFSGHVKQALASGKKLGLYHFIRNDADVKKQADYFLSKIQPYIGKAVLALDFEDNPNVNSYIQNQTGVSKAKQWLDYVYSKTGVRPLLYTGISCENSLDWSSVVKANYGSWIAQYNRESVVNGFSPRDLYGSLKHWKSMVIFQYASVGRLAGWAGDLDFDVFYGDKSTWDKYAKASIKAEDITSGTLDADHINVVNTKSQWVKEKKTYTLKTAVQLRKDTSTTAEVIATLAAGQAVDTDEAIIINGYRWVRQPRSDGYGYLATGPVANTLEYVTIGAAHTYYTVVSGDSWWAIGQRFNVDMNNLAKLNGKTTSAVIHPGDKLIIK